MGKRAGDEKGQQQIKGGKKRRPMDKKTRSEKTLLTLGSVFTLYWVILYEQPLKIVCLLKWEMMT